MSATASRFSVLRIENDEDERRAQSLRDKQKAAAEKLSGKKGNGNKSQAASDKNAAHQQRPKMSQEKAEVIYHVKIIKNISFITVSLFFLVS